MNAEQVRALVEPRLPKGPDVVLTTGPLLGLGDHCAYSTLPERFTALGYNVYLDADNKTSNPEIAALLWQRNPFIKGFSTRKPSIGYSRQGFYYTLTNKLAGHRSIEAMERVHGLPPPYGIAPKVYYDYQPFKFDLSQVTLADFSSVSSIIGQRGTTEAINMMEKRFRKSQFDAHPQFLQVVFKKNVSLHRPPIEGPTYEVSSIYEYLDMLHACRAWVGCESGGQSLASAVRGEHLVTEDDARPEVVCTITPKTFNSRGYTYANVDYRVTSDTDTSADYHYPHEVAVLEYETACALRAPLLAERV